MNAKITPVNGCSAHMPGLLFTGGQQVLIKLFVSLSFIQSQFPKSLPFSFLFASSLTTKLFGLSRSIWSLAL